MGKYEPPRRRLHRDFVYLNDESILNSLSAFEAGKVDEIIEKTTEATDRGASGSLGAGPVKLKGGAKRQGKLQEELVRTRTRFSSFEAWHDTMTAEEAIGRFNEWDVEVRGQLRPGDTIEFDAAVELTPLHMLFATFSSYVRIASTPGSSFEQKGQVLADLKKTARMMDSWVEGPGGQRSLMVYLRPDAGPDGPRFVARLDEQDVIGGFERVQGAYKVVGQVDRVLRESERVSVIRVLRDVPATPFESDTIKEALAGFTETGKTMGLSVSEDDLEVAYPAVILRPLAIYK